MNKKNTEIHKKIKDLFVFISFFIFFLMLRKFLFYCFVSAVSLFLLYLLFFIFKFYILVLSFYVYVICLTFLLLMSSLPSGFFVLFLGSLFSWASPQIIVNVKIWNCGDQSTVFRMDEVPMVDSIPYERNTFLWRYVHHWVLQTQSSLLTILRLKFFISRIYINNDWIF